jgi:hypothetical protein
MPEYIKQDEIIMKHIFAIDDTGSPGNISESQMLKSDRKTYVATFIHSDIREKLFLDIQNLISNHNNDTFKINELHFTELINRRKEYKNIESEKVKQIFIDFTNILKSYSLPFFVQTITPRTLQENGLINPENKSLDEIALDFLFQRIKQFIKKNNISNDFEIIIDEGLKNVGDKTKIEQLESIKKDTYMYFQSSEDTISLQIADFFAFGINRNQMMLIKENRTEFDISILTLINEVFQKNDTSGSKPVFIKQDEFSKNDYDKMQIETLKEKGIYDYWKKVNKKH